MATSADDTLGKIEGLAKAIASADTDTKHVLLHEYLDVVGHYLTDQGRGGTLAAPLFDLIEKLDAGEPIEKPRQERRAKSGESSEELLAHVSAVIDVLISSGYSLDHACQLVTRQLIARNVQIPAGGDARAWRNIQAFRNRLLLSKRDSQAWRSYVRFKEELPKLYGGRLGEAAALEAIWDRRANRD